MTTPLQLAIVGDHDDAITAHRAIPLALAAAASALDIDVHAQWVASDEVGHGAGLARFDAFWIAPGSPYRDMDGALRAITHARTRAAPLLGTCGGFQHAVIEYARNVLHWTDATHAESDPGVGRPVIAALECALVETRGHVTLAPASRLARAYGKTTAPAAYRCRYGLNPAFRAALVGGALLGVAEDETGELRAIELVDHPFFVATLWQPERAALEGQRVPLAEALIAAARNA